MKRWMIALVWVVAACGDDSPKKSATPVVSNNTVVNNTVNSQTNQNNASNNTNNASNNTANNVANNASNNGSNNAVSNNTVNNSDNNGSNNVVSNNTVNNQPDEITVKCQTYCDLLFGSCVTDNCSLGGQAESARGQALSTCLGTGTNSCVSQYRSNTTVRAEVEAVQGQGCFGGDVERNRCFTFGFDACSCPESNVSGGCNTDSDCEGGLLPAYCDGSYPGGFCITSGCNPGPNANVGDVVRSDATGCGADNYCYVADASELFCLDGCTSNATCRSGWACRIIEGVGTCELSCSTDDDCGGYICNGSTKLCELDCMTNADCDGGTCTGTTNDNRKFCEY